MRCQFCFAGFADVKAERLPKGHLPFPEALAVIHALCDHGVGKVTFAGGEPTLCPWLLDLVRSSKERGATTMVVTNGTRLSPAYLEPFQGVLDWVCLSIDSLVPSVNRSTGRSTGQIAYGADHYAALCTLVKHMGFRLKVNTVVHAANKDANMAAFISAVQPERWKLFQVLPVAGQNDQGIDALRITSDAFAAFVEHHRVHLPHVPVVPEDNATMRGSYLMVDPAGRFYDSSAGYHTYSDPILTVGVKRALEQVKFDADTFIARGGLYDWR